MQAVILAAGESSRFYPFNKLGHKSLVTLCGKTLLAHTLDSLRRAKITNVVIIEGIDEAVSKKLTPEDTQGLNIKYVIQEKATGMGDAILCAARFLEKSFFVLNAYHFEIDQFAHEMTSAQKQETDIVLLTSKTTDASEFGAVMRKNGKVTISEKKEKSSNDRIIGIYLLNRDFVSLLHEEKKDHYSFESAISTYSNKNTVVLVQTTQETLSLKYPWDLLTIKDYLLARIKSHVSKAAKVSKKAVLEGNIVVCDGATIMDGAVVSGPAYIGKNAYIGTNAIVRAGVCIEEGSVVGAQMEIKNSILMRGTTTHSGFIGDSVIGESTRIAAGFHTANVRLDKKDVAVIVKGAKVSTKRKYFGVVVGNNTSFGIKVGTMPGVIVGNSDVIGPGTVVMENVEDSVTYYSKIQGIIKKK